MTSSDEVSSDLSLDSLTIPPAQLPAQAPGTGRTNPVNLPPTRQS